MRGESVDGDELLGEVRESDGIVKVPEKGRKDVHVEKAEGVEGSSLEEGSLGLKARRKDQRVLVNHAGHSKRAGRKKSSGDEP